MNLDADVGTCMAERVGVTHRFPPRDTFIIMSCCGKTLYEVSPCDGMTLDPELVTCGKTRAAMSTSEDVRSDVREGRKQ